MQPVRLATNAWGEGVPGPTPGTQELEDAVAGRTDLCAERELPDLCAVTNYECH